MNNYFEKGIEEVIERKSLLAKLQSGKKLRIKIGVDPTSTDIHLGHAVALRVMKALQDDGHKIIFLIGDYTAKIGDPSGKNSTRPILTDAEIKKNAKTYFDQVGKILDLKKTEVRYNSEWYEKLNFNDILQLVGKFTVAQIIERDDFEIRMKKGQDISMSELLYPIMQAYDSVVLEADLEFGGSDQKFNMLAGRVLQRKMGQAPQDLVLVKLLVGTDGREKMSKSLGNYIGINESANSIFGKVMSIPDTLIMPYFELCTTLSQKEIQNYKHLITEGENPKNIKIKLAQEIVTLYHSKEQALEAKEEFENVFAKKELPKEMKKIKLTGNFKPMALLIAIEAATTNSEARRLVIQGALKIDQEKISDPDSEIAIKKGMTVSVGKKRYYKVT